MTLPTLFKYIVEKMSDIINELFDRSALISL
jgi:hypothetical protein